MKILVVGSGGREHTLAWACSRSDLKPVVYCAPGNGGTGDIARNADIDINDNPTVYEFCRYEKIDLVIVGPEAPLDAGLTDYLAANKINVFGPAVRAANIEGSKAFARLLMQEAAVPTPETRTFSDFEAAKTYLNGIDYNVVVKASGLAAGKGAIVTKDREEAIRTAREMLLDNKFGYAGNVVVIEERLDGIETSLMAFVDGEDYILLPPSRDHKQAFDNDEGANTGGMGAYSPVDDLSTDDTAWIAEKVFPHILRELKNIGSSYSGLLYAGIMLTDEGPKVLEFNCRFGDPETQVLLPIMKIDPLEIMLAVAEGRLGKWMRENGLQSHDWQKLTGGRHAVSVVVAADGYPGSYDKGMMIEKLPEESENVITFHAGTAIKNEQLISSGGRIVAVTGLGDSHEEAVKTAYSAISDVVIEGTRFRTDIGKESTI